MVQIITERPKRQTFTQRLNEGVGKGLEFGQQIMEKRQQEQQQKARTDQASRLAGIDLTGVDPALQNEIVKLKLQGANQKELELLKQQGKSKIPDMGDFSKTIQAAAEDQRNYGIIKNNFGQKAADLWQTAPQGGKTALMQFYIDSAQRGLNIDETLQSLQDQFQPQETSPQDNIEFMEESEIENSKEISKEKNPLYKELKNYLNEQDKDLLPSEIIARGKERYDTGLKEYQEAGTKLRALDGDKQRIDILSDLNKTKKLPKNLQRLNVDSEGNLRLPFLASPEAQRFVKTLNEFSASAKDTFGARVTNFDLAQLMKRFPNLLNTEEGRKQLLEQMKIVNQVNAVYYKNLKNIYDKAGGVRKIDSDAAERFAEKLSEPKINELTQKFKDIGEITSLPSASEHKGKRIRDKNTGEIFISDGEEWIPQG